MAEMKEIHNDVYQYLIEENSKNPNNFFFTVRKNNSSKRLEEGYWFHGNDNYLSVSFWSGMDWKNKTPNIYIQINSSGKCSFIFSAKDNEWKFKFAIDVILPILESGLKEMGIDPINKGAQSILVFDLGKGNYIEILKKFIHFIKPRIDAAVTQKDADNEAYLQEMQEYNEKDDIMGTQEIEDRSEGPRPIDFIWPSEFKKGIDRIKIYRGKLILGYLLNDKYYIKKVSIQGAGDIRKTLTLDIPQNTSWVFLTGENGCGKTTILRAITSYFHKIELANHPLIKDAIINLDSHAESDNVIPIAFASYGPSRLISTSSNSISSDMDTTKLQPWYGIFNPDGILQGFEELQSIFKKQPEQLDDIVYFLEEMFNYSEKDIEQVTKGDSKGELIPQLAEVNFDKFISGGIIKYKEKDKSNVVYNDFRTFDELASGVRSLLALIADLLIKLIEKNPNEPDLTNFRAVVLIDEIDIHFHPSMQKQIVEILSSRFPKVQFIVTTHSPVTLLGAPKNSVFYKVERTVETGITATRMKQLEKEIKNLLPNTILTSPIFGMDDLASSTNNDIEKINLDDHYNEKQLLKIVDEKIEEYIKRDKLN